MMWIVSLCRSRLVAVIAEAASRHGTASQVKVSTRLLLRGLRRVPTINLSHDFFSPPDRILDCAHGRRNTLSAFVLCQLPCRENARCGLLRDGGLRLRQSHELQEFVTERTQSERPSYLRIGDALGEFAHRVLDLIHTRRGRDSRNLRLLNRRPQVFFNQSVGV